MNIIVVGAPFKDEFEIYDLKEHRLIKRIKTKSSVACLAGNEFSSIISCGHDSTVTIWKNALIKESKVIAAHTEAVIDSQSTALLDAAVTVDKGGLMIVSSLQTGKPYASVQLVDAPSQVLLTPLGLIVTIFSGLDLTKEGRIEVRDLTCNLLHETTCMQGFRTACIAQMPDGVEFLLVCYEKRLVTIRLSDMNAVNIITTNTPTKAAAFNTEEMCLVVADIEGNLYKYQYSVSE